jgi:hypothetical protein
VKIGIGSVITKPITESHEAIEKSVRESGDTPSDYSHTLLFDVPFVKMGVPGKHTWEGTTQRTMERSESKNDNAEATRQSGSQSANDDHRQADNCTAPR